MGGGAFKAERVCRLVLPVVRRCSPVEEGILHLDGGVGCPPIGLGVKGWLLQGLVTHPPTLTLHPPPTHPKRGWEEEEEEEPCLLVTRPRALRCLRDPTPSPVTSTSVASAALDPVVRQHTGPLSPGGSRMLCLTGRGLAYHVVMPVPPPLCHGPVLYCYVAVTRHLGIPGKFRCRKFRGAPWSQSLTPRQSPQCVLLVCEKFAENTEFRVGNFAVNVKREISRAKLKCHEIPPPPMYGITLILIVPMQRSVLLWFIQLLSICKLSAV